MTGPACPAEISPTPDDAVTANRALPHLSTILLAGAWLTVQKRYSLSRRLPMSPVERSYCFR